MSWLPFNFSFRQMYEGGYRYLDRCGAFLLAAEAELDFVPGDAKPSGAKFEVPEHGIQGEADSGEIRLSQELPQDGGDIFAKSCIDIATLFQREITPLRVSRNGFAGKWVCSYGSEEAALRASLEFTQQYSSGLAETVGMVPICSKWEHTFQSGSFELVLGVQIGAFEFTKRKQVSTFRDSTEKKRRVDRQNARVDRLSTEFRHVLMIDVDVMEYDPPVDSLRNHFKEFKRLEGVLLKLITPP